MWCSMWLQQMGDNLLSTPWLTPALYPTTSNQKKRKRFVNQQQTRAKKSYLYFDEYITNRFVIVVGDSQVRQPVEQTYVGIIRIKNQVVVVEIHSSGFEFVSEFREVDIETLKKITNDESNMNNKIKIERNGEIISSALTPLFSHSSSNSRRSSDQSSSQLKSPVLAIAGLIADNEPYLSSRLIG